MIVFNHSYKACLKRNVFLCFKSIYLELVHWHPALPLLFSHHHHHQYQPFKLTMFQSHFCTEFCASHRYYKTMTPFQRLGFFIPFLNSSTFPEIHHRLRYIKFSVQTWQCSQCSLGWKMLRNIRLFVTSSQGKNEGYNMGQYF